MEKNDLSERLRKAVGREVSHCIGRDGGKLSGDRVNLKKRYLGNGYSDDDERSERGLSTYVDRTVLETVEWAKPSLMRVFCNDEIIRFDPRSPEQEQAAADATLYVNQVVFGRSMFALVHDVLADGLYQRVGWCLAHCPARTERRMSQYKGLTQQEATALLSDPSIGQAEGDVLVERQQTPYGDLYDVTLHQDVKIREVRLDPIPSEHVLISSDARDVESARFVACWTVKTASDLLKEGYAKELIDDLPSMDDEDEMPETAAGREVNDDGTDSHDGSRGATREFRIYEAWLDFDINGDGIAEKVKVTYCGEDSACKILK